MSSRTQRIQLRWSDLDPNFHLRHSSFYDLASQYRLELLDHYGITLAIMEQQKFAPVLLREECVFFREIRYTDKVYINFSVQEVNEDGSKWQILHEFKDEQGKVKAKLTVDIAWFDILVRRFANPLPMAVVNAHRTIMEEAT